MISNANRVQIPVIDINSNDGDTSRQLLDAAAKYGFVFVENNDAGVPPTSIAKMFDLSRDFFSSPLAVKQEVSISSNKAGKNHGWLNRGVEKLDPATQQRPDVKEAFNMGEPTPNGQLQQPLPKPLQAHADAMISFQRQCHNLCQRILRLFAIALDIEPEWFTSRHDPSTGPSGTVFRLLYYPHVNAYEDGVDIRAGAHSDYGSITLLFQQPGQPGLEIRTPGGEWAAVPVDPLRDGVSSLSEDDTVERPLPILVNIGDLLEDWTAGLLKSTVHRVIFPKDGTYGNRYSMAYFCHPLDDALLEPVPSRLVEERGAIYTGKVTGRSGKVITAKDHLMGRLAATY